MNPDTYDPRRLLDQIEAQAAKVKENAAALSAVEGWGEAADGLVRVCVGPSGALKNVELDPRAMRLPSVDLAASIVEAAKEGQRAAALSIREIYSVQDTGGIDVDAAHVKVPAAWLIERAGFRKGDRDGLVGISSKHPLAIVNLGGATARDVVRLAVRIKQGVADRFGVSLRPEPIFVGFGDDPDGAAAFVDHRKLRDV